MRSGPRRRRLLAAVAVLVAVLTAGLAALRSLAKGEVVVLSSQHVVMRSRRESFLNVTLPLALPPAFTAYMDALQFPASPCRFGVPAGTWFSFPLERFGIGAYMQHYTWYMSMLASERRMFVMLTEPSRKQPFQYGHSENCRQGFFCGFHPISKCADVEVWSGSEMRQSAEKSGKFFGHYGKAKPFNESFVTREKDEVVDIGSRWYSDEPHVGRCRWGHWVPPQFRRVGTESMWNDLMDKCNFSAFDSIPNGKEKASADVLRWRSWLAGYLFQPLPIVLKSIAAKQRRLRLREGDRCVSIHVRRGDKVKGPRIEGRFHALDLYLTLAQELISRHNGSGTIVLHSDDFVGVLREWKTSKFRSSLRLVYDTAESGLSGWNVNLLYSLADYYNVIGSIWTFAQCPLTVGSLESVYYKLGIHIGIARGIFEADNNIYGTKFVIGELANPVRGWLNFLA